MSSPKSFAFPIFIINLEIATQRCQHMKDQLTELGLPFIRIDAVLGRNLPEPIKNFDEKRFRILTGKERNLGEIGCYLSHIKAMEAFMETEATHALILEDDVNLPENLPELLRTALDHSHSWDLLRLTSSREGKFLDIANLNDDFTLAYNTRVLKNTGAYFINRKAAALSLKHMLPMKLPFDVALDREWDFGFKTACIHPFPVKLEPFEGQINKARRIRYYRATTFHLFHLWSRWQRKHIRRKYAQELGR